MFEFAGNSRFFNSRSHCQLERKFSEHLGSCDDQWDIQILHLWDCVPAPTPQWKHLPDGQFQNVQTGKYLAVREDSSENGTVLHIWDCHPGQTEKWSFER